VSFSVAAVFIKRQTVLTGNWWTTGSRSTGIVVVPPVSPIQLDIAEHLEVPVNQQ